MVCVVAVRLFFFGDEVIGQGYETDAADQIADGHEDQVLYIAAHGDELLAGI